MLGIINVDFLSVLLYSGVAKSAKAQDFDSCISLVRAQPPLPAPSNVRLMQ